jgi:hypothetical protein
MKQPANLSREKFKTFVLHVSRNEVFSHCFTLKEITLRPSDTPRTYRPTIWLHVSEDFDPQQQSLEKYKTSQLSLECIVCVLSKSVRRFIWWTFSSHRLHRGLCGTYDCVKDISVAEGTDRESRGAHPPELFR